MPNGTAALHLLASDKSGEEIEVALGAAMADATEALGAGLADYDAEGRLSDTSQTRGGETIAALVELQLGAPGEMANFDAIAIAAGRRVLFARHEAALRQHLGSDAGIDDVFGELLTHVLTVASKVTAIERVFRSN